MVSYASAPRKSLEVVSADEVYRGHSRASVGLKYSRGKRGYPFYLRLGQGCAEYHISANRSAFANDVGLLDPTSVVRYMFVFCCGNTKHDGCSLLVPLSGRSHPTVDVACVFGRNVSDKMLSVDLHNCVAELISKATAVGVAFRAFILQKGPRLRLYRCYAGRCITNFLRVLNSGAKDLSPKTDSDKSK